MFRALKILLQPKLELGVKGSLAGGCGPHERVRSSPAGMHYRPLHRREGQSCPETHER